MQKIISNKITVNQNGNSSALYLSVNSGKIIYRNKIDTIIGIKHPGIVLGKDAWENLWVIHNHYEMGRPQIVTWEQFSLGNEVFYDSRPVFYDAIEIIERAIAHWSEKNQYNWLYNNCQHFVNKVSQNKSYSETVDRVSNNTLILGGATTFAGIILSNAIIAEIGLGITVAGGLTKLLNRI